MQHAVNRICNRDFTTIQCIAFGFQRLHIAGHFRCFTQQHIEWHVDRLVVEVAVAQGQMLFFGSFTNHRIRRALALTQFVKQRQLIGSNRQHVAFLGFVTPDFQRAHTRLVAEDIAQLELTAATAIAYQLRHGVRQTTRANVMDKQNWVRITHLPATVDNFLATTFHFRVITLYRSEIKIGIRLTGSHRGGCPAAKANVHRRAAEDDQLGANDDLALLHVIGTDVTDPACQHDRFMVTAQLFAVMAVDLFFIGTEVAGQRRATKFVVKRRAAQRAFGHDVERGDNTIRLTKVLFPRLFKARNTQVGDGEAYQPGFRFCTTTGCTFIADFSAGAGCRTWPRRDSRRVVMSFYLHQDVGWFLMEIVAAGFVIGKIAAHFRTFHYRGVVFIGRQHVVRRGFEGILDHLEQRLRLLFTVDNPVGVKNLVAAVLGVGLRKHVQFNVVRVAPQFGERILQIVNFVFRQRQTQTQVSVDQRLTPLTQ